MALVLIPGIPISMGGRDFIVPPLTLGQLRRLEPKMRQLTTVDIGMGIEQIGLVTEIVATAMQRNYPEITPADVEELLDLSNAQEVMKAIFTGSGLRPRSSGESTAVANGGLSTGSWPPPVDTPTQ